MKGESPGEPKTSEEVRCTKMAASFRLSVSQCLRAAVLWILVSWAQCLETTCIEVKKSYLAKGFTESDLPFYGLNGKCNERRGLARGEGARGLEIDSREKRALLPSSWCLKVRGE